MVEISEFHLIIKNQRKLMDFIFVTDRCWYIEVYLKIQYP